MNHKKLKDYNFWDDIKNKNEEFFNFKYTISNWSLWKKITFSSYYPIVHDCFSNEAAVTSIKNKAGNNARTHSYPVFEDQSPIVRLNEGFSTHNLTSYCHESLYYEKSIEFL